MLKFLLIVFALSWPLQLMGYPHTSMIMVALGTFVAVHLEKELYPGLTCRKKSELLKVALFAFLIFLPAFTVSDVFRGFLRDKGIFRVFAAFLFQISVYLLYAYGEEVGWRGYMFPQLLERYEPSKALLVHNAIWAVWHLPILLALSSGKLEFIADFLGTFVHASLFAYFYYRGGLVASILYHSLWNGLRDMLITLGGVKELYIPAAAVLFIGVYLTLTPQIWIGGEKIVSGKS